MLKREKLPKMTVAERQVFVAAVAEERAAEGANREAARPIAGELLAECQAAVAVMTRFREARLRAGISLTEMESRTGIQKSALSRLENSKAPNPTLSTLQRYAAAIGAPLRIELEE